MTAHWWLYALAALGVLVLAAWLIMNLLIAWAYAQASADHLRRRRRHG